MAISELMYHWSVATRSRYHDGHATRHNRMLSRHRDARRGAPRARAEFSLWPLVELDEFYDNNVKLTPTNRKGDFVTAESFGATLEADTAARDFFLTYQTQLLEYASYGGHDRFGKDHAANLRDEEFLTPSTTLTVSDSLLVGNAVSNGILAMARLR